MEVCNLKLTIFQSFIGAVVRDMRAIAFDYSNKTISIYGYLDREPNDQDYDIIDTAITEIMSSYPDIMYQNIKLIESKEPIGVLDAHQGWIFVRYEG